MSRIAQLEQLCIPIFAQTILSLSLAKLPLARVHSLVPTLHADNQVKLPPARDPIVWSISEYLRPGRLATDPQQRSQITPVSYQFITHSVGDPAPEHGHQHLSNDEPAFNRLSQRSYGLSGRDS